MADNIITETNELEASNVPDAGQELASSMALALGLNLPVQQSADQNSDQNTDPNILAATNAIIDVPPVITFESIKEKFNYLSPEDAIKEIEELRNFKANPISEIEFANEESRKLFEAIQSGKQDEAYSILAEQKTLDKYTSAEVTKDNAADIIKLGMQYKYKDLTPEQIDYRFKKQFSIPREPIQLLEERDEEFTERQDEWKGQVADIEMDKLIEAKLVKPELESHKAKLVLPEIEPDVDEDYQNWKQGQTQDKQIDTETIEAYKSFTPKTIETKINFNDEANKIAFEFQYEPTAEGLKSSVDMVTDINKFYQSFIGQDGKPDRPRFLKAIHFALNADSILMTAMNQTKVATIKAQLPNNNGTQRFAPQSQEVSELQANMDRALNGFSGQKRN